MQSGKLISIGVWMMIVFNLLLSFGAVWSLQRIDPEIQRIYQRNVVSLDACEKMLLALAEPAVDQQKFLNALQAAENNITEAGERETVLQIKTLADRINSGATRDRSLLTKEIIKLTNFNKRAIIESALQAQKMRRAGAWGLVFMTSFFFALALYFKRRLHRSLLMPLEEISAVMESRLQGDKFRRCNPAQMPPDMKKLFASINKLLDDLRKNQ
ncbi:MAG: hypothetical protein IKA65_10220 [Lentisphaeria bacterium]|nr:hypothetical protein [Lentisphaeria bacterium]